MEPAAATPAPPPARARRVITALGVLGVSSLLSLLALEAVYRHQVWGRVGFSPTLMNSMQSIGHSGLIRESSFPELRYELRPNVQGAFKLMPFATNSHGMRDREYAVEKPPGTFRFAAVGDSFTMGEGVEVEDIYHSVLERELAAKADRPVEGLNFGVAGYALCQSVDAIRLKVLDWDPDLILVALNYFDLDPPLRDPATVPYVDQPNVNGFYTFHCLDALQRELFADDPEKRRDRERVKALRNVVEQGDLDLDVRTDGEIGIETLETLRRRYLEENFSALAELSREHDVPILVLYLTTTASKPFQRRGRVLENLCERFELPFVNTTSLFEGTNRLELTIMKTDMHPNARANRMYAERIRRKLARLGLLPGSRR